MSGVVNDAGTIYADHHSDGGENGANRPTG